MQSFVIDGKTFITISNTTHHMDASGMIYPQSYI
jgi:hypothetical protein